MVVVVPGRTSVRRGAGPGEGQGGRKRVGEKVKGMWRLSLLPPTHETRRDFIRRRCPCLRCEATSSSTAARALLHTAALAWFLPEGRRGWLLLGSLARFRGRCPPPSQLSVRRPPPPRLPHVINVKRGAHARTPRAGVRVAERERVGSLSCLASLVLEFFFNPRVVARVTAS